MTESLHCDPVQIYPDGRMDAKNAAKYCGLSEKTLAMKRCTKTGPSFIKTGKVFYFKDDIDAWLRAHRGQSTVEIRVGTRKGG